jgi:hypothetical protein
LIALVVLTAQHTDAQRQLILVSGRKVIHRFIEGETLRTKWKYDKEEHWGFIVEINEFSVITSQDTIVISDIKKILLPGKPFINKIGKTLIALGATYLIIDQFNWVVIQGQDPSLDDSVWKPATLLIGAGVPMLFFKKKWGRIKRGIHLISIDKNSKLYLNN